MALIMSFKERGTKLRACAGILNDAIALNKSIESYRDSLMEPEIEEGYANISTFVTGLLDQLATLIDTVRDELQDFDDAADLGLTYEETVRPYVNSAFNKWTIDVNNGSSKGKITANGGAPFTNYLVGDTILLSNFEDSDTDGSYVVDTVNSTQEILTTTVLGGADNATDTTGTIRITNR